MVLYRLLNPLRLNANITLCGSCAAMLKEPLHQCYIKPIGIVDFGCVPLAEAVGTDTLIAQIVTYNPKLLLYRPFCDWENQFIAPDAAAQAVILHVLLDNQRDSKDTPLACLLLHHFQPEAVTIPNHITEPQFEYITNPQAQISFQHKSRGNPLIWAAAAEALPHGLDDFLVLRCSQSLGFLVHGFPSNSQSSYFEPNMFAYNHLFEKNVDILYFLCS